MTLVLRERAILKTFDITPAGVRIRIRTNCESILKNAYSSRSRNVSTCAPIDLYVSVMDDLEESNSAPYFRGLHHLVYMSFGASSFVIDVLRRTVHATVTKEFATRAGVWRERIIPIILGVLGPSVGLMPLHAACLLWRDRGILLAGVSGAGKSTLAVALAKHGMSIISDDWTYVHTTDRGLSCHGLGVPVKLLADAALHFRELNALEPQVSLNGELAYEVDPAVTLQLRTTSECLPKQIIFLKRTSGPACLIPLSRSTVFKFFLENAERLPSQLEHLEETRLAILARLSQLPASTFHYSGTPQSGAETLLRWMEEQ
jgi:hypothetical protein